MKHIFSIPKVWEFPELRVQPGWQQVSRGRSRKEVMGDEITPHRRRLLLGISTHLFSLSLWLFVLSSDFHLLLQLGDQMAPTHYALNHGKARGVCRVSQQTQTRLSSLTASIWCTLHRGGTAAGTSRSTLCKIRGSFSSCRKVTAIAWAQLAGKGGSAVTHGRGQMLCTSHDAQCLMARSPGGPRTGGSCSPSDFPLQFVIKLVLTPCPVPVCRANSPGQDFWPWSTYWKKRQFHCLRVSLPLAFVK